MIVHEIHVMRNDDGTLIGEVQVESHGELVIVRLKPNQCHALLNVHACNAVLESTRPEGKDDCS